MHAGATLAAVLFALALPGRATEAGDPPSHVRGRALEQARTQAIEASRVAALTGSGHEAASILARVVEQAPQSQAAREARALLDDWGLKDTPLDSLPTADVALRVRQSLEMEETVTRACAHARVLLALGRADLAAGALAGISQLELRGAARRKAHELFATLGLEKNEADKALELPPAELHQRLERCREALRLTRLKKFLAEADPLLGKVFASILSAALPETHTLKVEEDRGFTAMPAMALGGGGGRGFRGGPGGFGPPGGFGGPGGPGGGGGRGRGGFDPAQMIRGFEDQIRGRGPSAPVPEVVVEPMVPPASLAECVLAVNTLEIRDADTALELARLAATVHRADPGIAALQDLVTRLSSRTLAAGAAAIAPTSTSLRPADLHFEIEEVASYALEIPAESLELLRRDPKAYAPAKLLAHDQVFEDVGLHLKGSVGTFQPLEGLNKPGFCIKINATLSGQKLDGLSKLILANGIQSMGGLGEWLGYAMFRQAGLPAPRIAFANVLVNGEPFGFYVEAEAVSRRALKQWFGDGDGDLYEGPGDVTRWDDLDVDTDETTADRDALKQLGVAAENAEKNATLDPLRELVDLPQLARFVALESLLAHWDGYMSTNNYRVYRDSLTQKFSLIPHGADQVLGSTRSDVLAPGRGVLARAILAGQEGRDLVRQELRLLLDRVFVLDKLRRDLLRGYLLVEPHILADARSPIPATEMLRRIEGLANRLEERRRFVLWQLAGDQDTELAGRMQKLARPASPFGFGR